MTADLNDKQQGEDVKEPEWKCWPQLGGFVDNKV